MDSMVDRSAIPAGRAARPGAAHRARRLALCGLLAGCSALLPGLAVPALGQNLPAVSRPVVQPLPGPSGRTLNEALSRVGRNPRDIEALLDAGNAALAMGDVDAAIGFYRRADTIEPGNPRVKAGLAGVMVRSGDPFSAIPLYNAAEAAGALPLSALADRGLAHDLVGDNLAAQKYYRQALENGQDDEVIRRLALSHAIAGDARASETTLAPLLERQDMGAWRTRAFALAIVGRSEEAVRTANSILPPELASSIAPYLRYMPRLTPAQQAAAANFGDFPRASAIGIDDPRVAQFAPARRPNAAFPAVASAEPGAGDGASRRARRTRPKVSAVSPPDPGVADASRMIIARTDRDRSQGAAVAPARTPPADRVAVPEPMPARQTGGVVAPIAAAPVMAAPVMAAQAAPAPVAASPAPTSSVVVAPVMGPPAPSALQESRPIVQPVPARAADGAGGAAPSSVDLAAAAPASAVRAPLPSGGNVASVAPPAMAAAPAGAPAAGSPVVPPASASASEAAPAPRPRPRSIFEAFADLSRPTVDVSPAAGAVDIRRIRPARETAAAEDDGKATAAKPAARKPAPPSHPSRIWVQIATGRDRDALAFDWRRLVREEPETFRGKQPSVSAWGQRNRLLAGPFPTEAAANAYIAQLRRAGVNGAFVWTSPAGQVVDALAVR